MARLQTASYVKVSLVIVVILLLFSIAGFGSCSPWTSAANLSGSKTQMGSSLVDAASVENLEIDWASGSVDIIVDPQVTQIEFSEASYGTLARAQEMRWEVSGKTLKIYYGGWFACSALSAKDLNVRIPASYASNLGNITIQGASGNYHMAGLACENLTVKLASGEFKALDMKMNEVNLEVASGQVLVDGQVSNKIRTDVASGLTEIMCRDVIPRSIDSRIASGTTSISLPENDGFSVKIRKASGTFQTAFPTAQQGDGLYMYKQGGITISIDMASGNFNLNRTA